MIEKEHTMNSFRVRWWSTRAIVPGALSLSLTAPALAVPCSELNLPNPIYGAGGSAITATLGKVATELAKLPEPITVLFADPGACIGYQAFLDNSVTTTFKYWDAAGTQLSCDPEVTGTPVEFAHMGNTADFCPGLTLPADVQDHLGPIQTLNIITSVNSSETSISSEALYFAYGFGAESQAEPWTVEANFAKRNATSFVHLFLADSVKLSAEKFKGVQVGTNQESVNAVVAGAATDPDSTLGYVSGSAADDNRDVVKTLAYQHTGQACGYYPDSNETSFDKRNVRQGIYQLWTPGHFFARGPAGGEPTNPAVANLIGWFDGSVLPPAPLAPTAITAIIVDSGDIPSCAMQVTREGVTGPISSFAPDQPCGCFFEQTATGQTSCTACVADADCGATSPKCRSGFCEAY
jgi:hypothetical protein